MSKDCQHHAIYDNTFSAFVCQNCGDTWHDHESLWANDPPVENVAFSDYWRPDLKLKKLGDENHFLQESLTKLSKNLWDTGNELDDALIKLDQIAELHRKVESTYGGYGDADCYECGEVYPCPTMKIVK